MQFTMRTDSNHAATSRVETQQARSAQPSSDSEDWFIEPALLAIAVAVAYVVLGLFMALVGDATGEVPYRHLLLNAGLSLYGCAGGIWMLAQWYPALAVRVGALGFGIVATVGASRLGIPGFLLLMPLPLFLFGSLGSIRTVLVLIASQVGAFVWFGAGIGWPDLVIVLLAHIGALLLAFGAQKKQTDAAKWAYDQYEMARHNLEQARIRNMDLSQVLDELLHSHRQLDLMNERVAAMHAKAEEAQRAKATFVAKVSHEFRTPLNMIIGLTDLLIENPQVYGKHLPPALVEDLQIVHRNCEHLSSMVNDILDLSQTEAGRLTLQREQGDLAADIQYAVTIVRPLAEKRGLTVRVEGAEQAVSVVRDPTRTRQVFLNLLSNAARYTVCGEITVRLRIHSASAIVEIADTGPGIEPDDLERIFEPFYQAGSMDGRSQKGSGLGLSITKQFVELHGGRLWVESVLGEGSTFYISLPVSTPMQPVLKPAGWIHPEWHWLERESRPTIPTLPRRRRIVLYDETDGFHPLLDVYTEGLELVSAQHVDEVGKALTTPAHAVIVNADSPQQAFQLVDTVRRQDRDTPVIGWAVPSPISRALEAGALDYLIKPVTRADLVEALAMVGNPVRRILIVDDDEEIRRLLGRMLHAHDACIELMVATDQGEALAHLYNGQPDLMLLDLTLTDGSGWELLAHKQADSVVRDIPTIIISAQDPMDAPLVSGLLIAALGAGLSRETLARASLRLAELMLDADAQPGPTHLESRDGESAW